MPDDLSFESSVLERGVSEVAPVFDLFEVGVYCVNREGFFTYVNPAGEALLGWDPGELLGRHAHDTVHHSRQDGSPFPREECPFYEALQRARAERNLDDVFWRRDGSALLVGHSIAPLYEHGEHVGAIIVFGEIGDRQRAAEQLRTRAAQQAALAELGLRALGGGAVQELLDHASTVVAEMLGVEFSQVLKLIDEQSGLRLLAGVGWQPGTVGAAHVGFDGKSQAGYALACDQPIVVEDWWAEKRFRAPDLLRDNGVRSGVSVVIHGRDHPWGTAPWGVVGAHTRSPRGFTTEDLAFLQAVANTLALAIERSEAEREVSALADERRRIMADALAAEDRTREQISQLLHDEVLQSLLSARQDLAGAQRAGTGKEDLVRRAREAVVEAITELRDAVTALHPVTRVRGGPLEAIRAIAEVHARRGGFGVSLNVEPEASGVSDQLIVSLARELLSNAAQHSGASHVSISLRRAQDEVVFEVADDGHGMDPDRSREALVGGHIGLASIAMRVEACGGRFQLDTSPGEGTRVQVTLPAGPTAPGLIESRSS
jgi:PAS domain S-box-containing protein